jgi:AraC family transcriptional regulator
MALQVEISSDRSIRYSASPIGSETMVDDVGSTPLLSTTLTQEQRTRLGSVVRLLETAGQTLPHGDSEAYRCVAKAAALLQAECKLGSADTRADNRHDLLPAWKMARVMSFVDENINRSIRIEEMAMIARLSGSHFSRAFRSTAGEPPSAFVIRRRVERAEQLILLTDKSLAEIALDCGMADQAHLTKLFRRSHGISPGKWRKLQQGSDRADDDQQSETLSLACARGVASVVKESRLSDNRI